ncbi:alpha/beta hydrolase [Streptomyces sp. NBC_01304]|uniref:alpha/beta hydrolase n=1 Tax=Streptomyces sp. NBC_01304 TaxID=2903818 RepID=UPI002E11FF2E|nr:alpha/beta hydrolase [Streptomyces sp. NBC_01304]
MTTPVERAFKELEVIRVRPLSPQGPDSVESQRRTLEETAALVAPPADAVFEPVPALPGLLTTVPESADDRVVLQLHGGGYHIGSTAVQRDLTARIARAAKAKVYGIDYPLAPEHPYPAAVLAARKAYEWLLGQGYAPERIVLTGDSAGGGLALATLVGLRDLGLPLPGAAVVMSPWVDLTNSGESVEGRADRDPVISVPGIRQWAASYLAGADPRDPLASPLYADLTGLPPLLIQVGTEEVLFDDSTRLYVKAAREGVDATLEVAEGMPHVWQIFADFLPEAAAAIENLGRHVLTHVPEGAVTEGVVPYGATPQGAVPQGARPAFA